MVFQGDGWVGKLTEWELSRMKEMGASADMGAL